MPDILIRNVSEAAAAAIQSHAAAAGQSQQQYLIAMMERLAERPITTARYAYRAIGPGMAVVRRVSDHPNGTVTTGEGWSQEQAAAMGRVKLLVIRNKPGDREAAVSLLQSVFELVVEVA